MPRRIITDGISWGPYSPAVVAGNFCFVTGQAAIDPATNKPVGGGIEAETRQTLENMKHVLEAAGFSLTDVVKVNCYLRDIDEWARMNTVYAEYFPVDPPARAAVEVGKMAAGLKSRDRLHRLERVSGGAHRRSSWRREVLGSTRSPVDQAPPPVARDADVGHRRRGGAPERRSDPISRHPGRDPRRSKPRDPLTFGAPYSRSRLLVTASPAQRRFSSRMSP